MKENDVIIHRLPDGLVVEPTESPRPAPKLSLREKVIFKLKKGGKK